jgi:hypothetical protein
MLILSPGVFISKLKEVGKYYPIELYLGGSIGNHGETKSKFHKELGSGVFTLYFDKSEIQKKWMNYL